VYLSNNYELTVWNVPFDVVDGRPAGTEREVAHSMRTTEKKEKRMTSGSSLGTQPPSNGMSGGNNSLYLSCPHPCPTEPYPLHEPWLLGYYCQDKYPE
jgi:hypothetical protein